MSQSHVTSQEGQGHIWHEDMGLVDAVNNLLASHAHTAPGFASFHDPTSNSANSVGEPQAFPIASSTHPDESANKKQKRRSSRKAHPYPRSQSSRKSVETAGLGDSCVDAPSKRAKKRSVDVEGTSMGGGGLQGGARSYGGAVPSEAPAQTYVAPSFANEETTIGTAITAPTAVAAPVPAHGVTFHYEGGWGPAGYIGLPPTTGQNFSPTDDLSGFTGHAQLGADTLSFAYNPVSDDFFGGQAGTTYLDNSQNFDVPYNFTGNTFFAGGQEAPY
ncbi:hypothetical protein DICSQDRAFT_129817 [Dichomitus squalens LYAD-421 SS1]|uniref:Uncharacterized protein n=1 Tax=Dichomitus squalens (strain LYAD-421) TaxID=732165 RepID=R7SMA2_DICSQ|nr:uncharacterized protein DICSQDRAFT_129817 [Dichomitus squalens LYAD-421 SS1]EJF56865.1 hypothetical protein DICSQDRAFT_129817 [Dichomitus squalens LYAD-421 SS1]